MNTNTNATDTGSQLLAAILAEPAEDTPRLVYADWLDENGHASRAAYIRGSIMHPETVLIFDREPPWAVLPDGVTPTWSRGFVSAVTLTAAAFLGGECQRCGGSGERNTYESQLNRTCPACNGTGRTKGVAKELFASHPIERVTLSDVEIFPSGGNDTYYVGGLGQFPSEYWRMLDNHPSEVSARTAVSTMCVRLGRSLAGLLPLHAHTQEVR